MQLPPELQTILASCLPPFVEIGQIGCQAALGGFASPSSARCRAICWLCDIRIGGYFYRSRRSWRSLPGFAPVDRGPEPAQTARAGALGAEAGLGSDESPGRALRCRCFFLRGVLGKSERASEPSHGWIKCLSQILDHMPAVGNLKCRWGSQSSSFGKIAGPITTDDFDPWMLP